MGNYGQVLKFNLFINVLAAIIVQLVRKMKAVITCDKTVFFGKNNSQTFAMPSDSTFGEW
jgi:hypothetical protein